MSDNIFLFQCFDLQDIVARVITWFFMVFGIVVLNFVKQATQFKTLKDRIMRLFRLTVIIAVITSGGLFLGYAQVAKSGIPTDLYYTTAYTEIIDMLEGRKPMDFKRAVFLPEWAYLRGELDYEAYCSYLSQTGKALLDFMELNGLDKHPIGGNMALFEYFTNPNPLNNFKPYIYDFEDFSGDHDRTKLFVTKLISTHSGQCRSLPLLYKLLANEIGAEAYIAYAPNHSFIRHKDEDGSRFICLELTNHSMPREIFIIENMGITQTAIDKGTYMKPCDDGEIVLDILSELAGNYFDQFGVDDFALEIVDKVLEYEPSHLKGLFIRNNMLVVEGYRYQDFLNARNLSAEGDGYMQTIVSELKRVNQLIEETGHIDMPEHLYNDWIKSVEEEIKRRETNMSN